MKKFSVSQLGRYIKNVFDDEFLLSAIEVEGEITDCKVVGGNTYFALSEGGAYVSCIYFGLLETVTNGSVVVASGGIKFYPKTGRMSLIVRSAVVAGKGDKHRRLQELKTRLMSEGCFDRLVPLPKVITSVVLVTSIEGAVVHDFLRVARDVNDGIDIAIYPVRVQGEDSASELAHALDDINSSMTADCIVIARGGGSTSDLDTFNAESVVRAVARSRIATVAAIGHEIDYTLCDLAASERAGTPSIAAQMVITPKSYNIGRVESCIAMLDDNLQASYIAYRDRLKGAIITLIHNSTLQGNKVEYRAMHILQELYSRACMSLEGLDSRLRAVMAVLSSRNPAKLMLDGYARLVVGDRGVRSIDDIIAGDNIDIYMQGGVATAVVKDIRR